MHMCGETGFRNGHLMEIGEEGSGGGSQLYFVLTLVFSLEWEGILGICMPWPQAAEYSMITNKPNGK